jgi:prephenate dehydrogenase
VTDVGSTKARVVQLAERLLPAKVRFVGSHPIAGSEKTGVEFARADLFDRALCIVTPTDRTAPAAVRWIRAFWESIGATTTVMDARRHDVALARVSHLPHAVATALVNLSLRDGAIDVAGSGFADVTRVASGDPDMWTDIFRTNRTAVIRAVDRLVAELNRLRQRLDDDDAEALRAWLAAGKEARDEWIANRYRKKVLPP